MSKRIFLGLAMAPALAAAAPASALAVPALADSAAQARILIPLTVQKIDDLDFGGVTATAAGTITLDPVTSAVSTTGGVVASAGTPRAARFIGAASGNAVVNIKLPRQPVTLTRIAGTETMQLRDFTLDSPSKRVMAGSTAFEFQVGGTVDIGAGQADGTYVGTFTVTVQYP
jgi:hypothetical protein